MSVVTPAFKHSSTLQAPLGSVFTRMFYCDRYVRSRMPKHLDKTIHAKQVNLTSPRAISHKAGTSPIAVRKSRDDSRPAVSLWWVSWKQGIPVSIHWRITDSCDADFSDTLDLTSIVPDVMEWLKKEKSLTVRTMSHNDHVCQAFEWTLAAVCIW